VNCSPQAGDGIVGCRGGGVELQDESLDLLAEGFIDEWQLTHVGVPPNTGEVLGPGLDAPTAAGCGAQDEQP
jgi:hypothetical protein